MLGRIVASRCHHITLATCPLDQRYPPCDRAAQEHSKGVLSHNPMSIDCRIDFAVVRRMVFKVSPCRLRVEGLQTPLRP